MPTIERACETAGIQLYDVDAIAVTSGPGLAGALLVGVAAAKALALGLGKPLYGVNHLAAHVAVDQLEHGPLPEPCVAMLVSGGHSSLLQVADVTTGVEPLGATIDDAAGEAFDKVARLLGLPFPGGPHIDRAARVGQPRRHRLPARSHLAAATSSGTASTSPSPASRPPSRAGWRPASGPASRCRWPTSPRRSRRRSATCSPARRSTPRSDHGVDDLLIGGGVAANSRLRVLAEERAAAKGIRVRVPRPGLCTDNGAMVAALGSELVARGRPPSALDLPADSSLPVTTVVA